MVEKIANSMTNQMIESGLINNSKKEYYIYALVSMIEKSITILIIMIISIHMRVMIPTIFFLIFFFSLRSRTGGYHAKNFLFCFAETILIYITIINVLCPLFIENKGIMYAILAVCVLIIEMIGAVNHPNWDLSLNEFQGVKKAARLLALLEYTCILTAEGTGIDETCISFMATVIIVCAVSLSISKIIKQEVKEYEGTN